MVIFTHKISDPKGLHAVSASALARFCLDNPCRIRVSCKGSAADARQLMGLMKLRAKRGDILEFQVEGEGQEQTAQALKTLAGELL
ncbi:MAG: HPr family phosphocarrier protein [Hungatella sp.]|jgi:phosphotransferase system HPr (HPr) family protein|nr:HPr family phosphocarrier protein [Hungatella sp.]